MNSGDTIRDDELLRQYADHRSEAAFAELVGRHVDWVYSVALRQVRDPHSAEDVTQNAFMLLARKAGTFDADVVVHAWLFRAVRYLAADAVKARRRRERHERAIGAMMDTTARATTSAPTDARGAEWERIAPVLDDAVAGLGAKDRAAILLRFHGRKSHAEVGAALGVSEAAAKMRVARAVEKLRAAIGRRGVAVSTVALASAVAEGVVGAAPAHLHAATVAAATTGHAAGAAVNVSLAPWKGWLLAMTIGKTSVVATCAVIALLAVTVAVYWSAAARPPGATAGNAPPGAAGVRQPPPEDFIAAYRLQPGETVRRVAPPFGRARRAYVDRVIAPVAPQPGALPEGGPAMLVLAWTDGNPGTLAWQGFENEKPTLGFLLQTLLRARSWDFDAPPGLLNTAVEGDWVFRASGTPAARVTAVRQVLAEQVGLSLTIERKRVNAEVIVVAGSMIPTEKTVQVYSDKLRDGRPVENGARNDFSDFLEQMQVMTRKRFVNESSVPSDLKLRVAMHQSGMMGPMAPQRAAAKLDLILANLSRQTGLRFTRATRPLELWVVRSAGAP